MEAQLRSEVLHSEEQRALIEFLKQALETQVDKATDDASLLAAFAQAQADADPKKREAMRLQLAAHKQVLERLQPEETREAEGLQLELNNPWAQRKCRA